MTVAASSLATALPAPSSARDSRESTRSNRWVLDVAVREAGGITRMLRKLLGNEADVLDAFQDAFCKLARCADQVQPRSARAYAYRTAVNAGIELIRERKRRSRHWESVVTEKAGSLADYSPFKGASSEPIENERLRGAIESLPSHLRNVVVLRDLGRLSYEEVGRMLGIAITTARVYRRQAVIRLAALLNGQGAGDERV